MQSLPSLFFVTLPKSGTNFTAATLPLITGLKQPEFLSDKKWFDAFLSGFFEKFPEQMHAYGDFNNQSMFLEGTKRFLPNGYLFGTHMRATFQNIQTMRLAGIKRCTVLIRDPRDSTVSWTHHIANMGEERRNLNSVIQHLPKSYYKWEHNRQLAFQVRNFLPAAINFIESWLGVFEDELEDLAIHLAYYDDLKVNSSDYFQRLLRFHQIKEFDLGMIPSPKKGKLHYRKGMHGQWEREFSEEDKIFSSLLIGNRLSDSFREAASGHRSWALAVQHLKQRNFATAAYNLAKVLDQFPYFQPAIRKISEIWDRIPDFSYNQEPPTSAHHNDADLFIRPSWARECLPIILAMKPSS